MPVAVVLAFVRDKRTDPAHENGRHNKHIKHACDHFSCLLARASRFFYQYTATKNHVFEERMDNAATIFTQAKLLYICRFFP